MTAGGAATILVGVQAGKVFAIHEQPFSALLEVAYTAGRPRDSSFPRWFIGLEFSAIFPEGTK